MNEITFKHRKTGKIVITPAFFTSEEKELIPSLDITWKELRSKLYESDDWVQIYTDEIKHSRIGVNTYHLNNKINEFFSYCKGHEKYGQVRASGLVHNNVYSPMRLMNRILLNHSAMIGDRDTFHKCLKEDEFYYKRVSPLNTAALLPAP